ncbi:Asp23/Gls24 family envelope stress response protein [Microbispora sp. RL4-1S]|uniref:Asp23/Gls24 family envelope stress response protein n=1 Tax=Microbispora oryzae TaxID=2806554 RepID=A0A941ASB3_9ACTN|nr:Asp23/Gls24 family envelope stress response protein [Microbispora oryzae]
MAERVLSCPDVARLSGGPFGTVATYLPGFLIPGIAQREDHIEVHVVARYGRPLPEVAEAVRAAIGHLAGERRVDVTIADVAGAGDLREEE